MKSVEIEVDTLRNEDSIIPETKPDRFGLRVVEVIKSSFLTPFTH